MKSYSDEVADTNKVAEVEQKLAAQILDSQQLLAQTIGATASVVAEHKKTISYLKLRVNIQAMLIVLVIIIDILHYGY